MGQCQCLAQQHQIAIRAQDTVCGACLALVQKMKKVGWIACHDDRRACRHNPSWMAFPVDQHGQCVAHGLLL